MQINLSEIRKERKYIEQDAQLLANRIKLLQMQDEKAWKKIQETKKIAKKYAMIKKDQMERIAINQEIKEERERALSVKRNTYNKMREIQKKEKDDIRTALVHAKHEEASNVKNQRESNMRAIKDNLKVIREDNERKKEFVKSEKTQAKEKIFDFQQKKNLIGRDLYWKKIEENEKLRTEKVKEVEAMEKLEIELIKRLENSQFIRDHAVSELESLIKSPLLSSVSPSVYRKRYNDTNFN